MSGKPTPAQARVLGAATEGELIVSGRVWIKRTGVGPETCEDVTEAALDCLRLGWLAEGRHPRLGELTPAGRAALEVEK